MGEASRQDGQKRAQESQEDSERRVLGLPPAPRIDAQWRKGREACRAPMPGCSVWIRDIYDPEKDRKIPCGSVAEVRALMAAVAQFARDGVEVSGSHPQEAT